MLAPAAFLLAATILVLLVRSAIRDSSDAGSSTTTAGTATQSATTTGPRRPPVATKRVFYTIESGDTLGGVATKKRTTVAKLQTLNPGIDPTSLRVGQKIRVG